MEDLQQQFATLVEQLQQQHHHQQEQQLLAVIRQDGAAAFKMFCWAHQLVQRSAVQLSWPAAARTDLQGEAELLREHRQLASQEEEVLVLAPCLEGIPRVRGSTGASTQGDTCLG